VPDERQIRIEEDGRLLSQATVRPPDENRESTAHVHVASGQLPSGTRRKMADAIHEVVTEDEAERLTATLPLGDAELVEGIKDHLSECELRAAGATSILRGQIKPGPS
jgi:hypothetical protein